MKIVLTIEHRGRNIAFVTDTLETLSLKKAIVYAEKGRLELVHIVKTKLGKYLRSNPNSTLNDNLDALSVSLPKIGRAKDDIGLIFQQSEFRVHRKLHQAYLESLQERGDIIITVDEHLWTPQQWVIDEISHYTQTIQDAAQRFSIDPNLLGAIIIDEYARYSIFDVLGDESGALMGANTSVGIAQVSIKTAKDVIKNRYYNPNPNDSKLKPESVQKVSNAYLYKYVQEPKHNIFLAAARIRQIVDHWSDIKDLTEKPEIIATLYSQGLGHPKTNPESSDRGKQITGEFYRLFQDILKQ